MPLSFGGCNGTHTTRVVWCRPYRQMDANAVSHEDMTSWGTLRHPICGTLCVLAARNLLLTCKYSRKRHRLALFVGCATVPGRRSQHPHLRTYTPCGSDAANLRSLIFIVNYARWQATTCTPLAQELLAPRKVMASSEQRPVLWVAATACCGLTIGLTAWWAAKKALDTYVPYQVPRAKAPA